MRSRLPLFIGILILSLTVMAGVAKAADLALIISNGDYDNLSDERKVTREHQNLVAAFKTQGYQVIDGLNLSRREMQALVQRADDITNSVASLVVVASANIVTDNRQTWVLPTDVDGDSAIEAGFGAPTLDVFLSLAARKPGHGFVFLGLARDESSRASDLRAGIGGPVIPQGVLLVNGPADEIAALLRNALLTSRQPLATSLASASKVSVQGFVSPDVGLRPAEIKTDIPATGNWVDYVAEQALWAVADRSNKRADFEEYLRRFPTGAFAQAARQRLLALAPPVVVAPTSTAESIEAAMNLSRDERRAVQANLTLLGFDTRGVDGIFGAGSRAAIATWQRSQRFEGTGFLNATQLLQLQQLADVRRAETEATDRRYWNATGAAGDKVGLQAYLEKYPNGLFATQAREALAELDAAYLTRVDNAAWSLAVNGNTADSYRAYLAQYPSGIYASIAKQRILKMDPDGGLDGKDEFAKAQEDRLQLNTATRLLIEGRLRNTGFDPGPVDGVFDEATRKAIRKYQKDRGLDPTGYIDPGTVRSLLLG